MGTPESPAALFKAWRILPNQIREITAATSERHPRLDDVSAKAAGPDYARRWDAGRTAWMRDHTPDSGAGIESSAVAGSGLNLSALRSEPEAPAHEDEMLRRFRAEIDAQFGTAPEPAATSAEPPVPGGLNLSALRGEQDSPAQQAALAALLAAGPEGTGASAIARALADAYGTTRQTVVGWLKTWMQDGTAVRVGEGTKARYIHRCHASDD